MIADPPVRRDGKCACSGCSKRKPGPSRYAGDQILRDPFCSTECCKAFHGCSVDANPELAAVMSERGRRGKAAGPLSDGRPYKDAA